MSFVFSFVGSVFIALIILLYNDMIIILDLWSDDLYYIIIYIYMIIINFLIEACFVGYIGAMLIFLGPYYI